MHVELTSVWSLEENFFIFLRKRFFKKHMDDLQGEKILEKFILVLRLNCRTLIQWKRLLSVCRNKKCGTGSVSEILDLPL